MTKLEKIDEIIREYRNGDDIGLSDADIIDCIEKVIAEDDEMYDRTEKG